MTWLHLALANLRHAPLTTAVNTVLMGLGAASIVLLLLAGTQLSQTMSRDAEGIDLVLGAQGSPVQLVLSAVYHADVPTGNIPLHEAMKWAEDPRVALHVPVSLGDSVRGFRIVGTEHALLELYRAEIESGQLWNAPMEAVVGADVAAATLFGPGATFSGAHGLVEGGHAHESQPYRVVGTLAPTGTVLDRLVVTSLESVWDLHGSEQHDHEAEPHDEESATNEHQHDEDDHDEHEHAEAEEHGDLEITAMLLSYRTPMAAITLPREINAAGRILAAAPALEISRVLQLVGVGLDALSVFAWVLVAVAALSIFAALYGSLRARRGELAMLRCLGSTRTELLVYLIIEGLLMAFVGIVLGFLLGHGMMEAAGRWLASSGSVSMTGWTWVSGETWLLLGLLAVGVMSAIVPAIQAYRTDVAKTLAEG